MIEAYPKWTNCWACGERFIREKRRVCNVQGCGFDKCLRCQACRPPGFIYQGAFWWAGFSCPRQVELLGGVEPYVEKVVGYLHALNPKPLQPWPIEEMVRRIGYPDFHPSVSKIHSLPPPTSKSSSSDGWDADLDDVPFD